MALVPEELSVDAAHRDRVALAQDSPRLKPGYLCRCLRSV